MKKPVVYLAGAIRKHPDPISWRLRATEFLTANGFEVLNPLASSGNLFHSPGRVAITQDETVVDKDLWMIDHSDVVLAEMAFPDLPYIGTSMEIMYAYRAGKAVIIFGKAHADSIWVQRHSTQIWPCLKDALEVIRLEGVAKI